MTFGRRYLGLIVRPRATLEGLVRDEGRLGAGLRIFLVALVTYQLVYVFLVIGGGRPTAFTPWLAVPAEDYYRYNVLWLAPSMFLALIASSGIVQLLARPLGGRGTFEDTVSVFAASTGVASTATGVHDVTTTFLGALGVIDQRVYEDAMSTPTIWAGLLWAQMLLYVVAFSLLFSKSVAAAHRLPAWPSTALGLTGFAVYQIFFVVFNR